METKLAVLPDFYYKIAVMSADLYEGCTRIYII